MSKEILYPNAPLVEVIIEVRWELQSVFGLKEAAIDPHFATFSEKFTSLASEAGFNKIESLAPDDVPKEFFAHKVIRRYRTGADKWPLMQIGPGVFTVNIIPPYGGWTNFRKTIDLGLKMLWKAYPQARQNMKVNALDLRYIDAFTEDHGMLEPTTFIQNALGFGVKLSDEVASLAVSGQDSFLPTGRLKFTPKKLKNAEAFIKYDTGRSNAKPAVVIELRVIQSTFNQHITVASATKWLDAAHDVLRAVFEATVGPEVKSRLGEAEEVGKNG